MRGRPTDDISVPFPISVHMLDLSPRVPQVRPTPLRRTMFAQLATLGFVLCLSASSFGLTYGKINGTISYFRDDENSRGNVFSAGLLGFRVNPGHETVTIAEAGSVFLFPLMQPDSGSSPIMYRIRVEETASTSALCSLLTAEGTSSPFIYSGKLRTMSTEATTTFGHWGVQVLLPDATGLSDGDQCEVDFVYTGWNKDAPEGTGYTDEERDSFTFIYSAPSTEQSPFPQSSIEPPPTPTDDTIPPADVPLVETPPVVETPPAELIVETPTAI